MIWREQHWQHCEAIYSHTSTAKECIRLQDQHGCNVNLLLLALYLDRSQLQLSPVHWQQLKQAIAPWYQQTVDPFRRIRQKAKSQLSDQHYQQLLATELILERHGQTIVTALLQKMHLETTLKTTNLKILIGNIQHNFNCTI